MNEITQLGTVMARSRRGGAQVDVEAGAKQDEAKPDDGRDLHAGLPDLAGPV